jgi:hypothetical protein
VGDPVEATVSDHYRIEVLFKDEPLTWVVTVWARDEKHAKKVALEKARALQNGSVPTEARLAGAPYS